MIVSNELNTIDSDSRIAICTIIGSSLLVININATILIVERIAVPNRNQIEVHITSLLSDSFTAISLITTTASPSDAIDEKKLTNAAT